jgi:polysaccharide biosynthesis transport protein
LAASQALTVREHYGEGAERIGHLSESEQLKHSQEVFLELARSPAVIAAALRQVGPPPRRACALQWPDALEVAAAQKKTEVAAPNGLEFGTTRMFYLRVADPDPRRALELTTALCDAAEHHFHALWDQETRDRIAQLTHTVSLTSEELDRQTQRLREMEITVGSDLAELRMLSDSYSGTGTLQATLSEVQQELRHAEGKHGANEQLLKLLTAARDDPATLVATPNQLLDAQPALRRLKEGLIDAQLNTSQLMGTMSADHPRVLASVVAGTEIRGHLHRELEVAIRSLRAEQAVTEIQLTTLTQQVEDLRTRLQRLAGIRATYSKQLAEVQQQTATLTRVQQDLNAARARLAAGDVANLVTRVDVPQTGPYPQGPGRTVIAAAGCAGGLLVGLGLLLLTFPSPAPDPVASSQNLPPATDTVAAIMPRESAPEPPSRPVRATGFPVPPTPPSVPSAAPVAISASHTRGMTLKEGAAPLREHRSRRPLDEPLRITCTYCRDRI